MTAPPATMHEMAKTSRHVAQRLMAIGGNRFDLLAIELKEERDHIFHTALLALIITALGLLAGVTVTAAIVIALWTTSPTIVLLTLAGLYATVCLVLCHRLTVHLREWQSFADSLAECKKDQFLANELCA